MVDVIVKENRTVRRTVHFSNVHVREYDITLGDHPIADAYPLSLDWSYGTDQKYRIDEFQGKCNVITESESDCSSSNNNFSFCRPSERMKMTKHHSLNRLDVIDRRSRLANVMGITYEKLDSMERERKIQS